METKSLEAMNILDLIQNKVIDVNKFREFKKLNKDSIINDIIKEAVLLHKKTNDGLEELIEMCQKDKNGR